MSTERNKSLVNKMPNSNKKENQIINKMKEQEEQKGVRILEINENEDSFMRINRPVQMQKRAEICAELWPNSAPLAQNINLFNLMNGRTKKIAPRAIVCLCRILETTPDGLFEWDKNCKKS